MDQRAHGTVQLPDGIEANSALFIEEYMLKLSATE